MSSDNIFVMLIGLPMTGKSFSEIAIKRDFYTGGDIFRISSDDFVEEIAYVLYMTYDEVWNDVKGLAQKAMDKRAQQYFDGVKNKDELLDKKQFVIWDQTNLTKKSRAKKLALVPQDWKKIAINYSLPGMIELAVRKKNREKEGKHIPQSVLDSMQKTWEDPSFDEGFDEIYTHDFGKFIPEFRPIPHV